MSDLQCAARFVVLDVAGLGDLGPLVPRLAGERVVALYAAQPLLRHPALALLAAALGLPADPVDGELGFGGDGYADLADRHRGETAVVVRRGESPHPVLLLVDADGFATQPFG